MTNKINQREAVYNALHAVCKELGKEFVDGSSDANQVIASDVRAAIIEIVTEGLLTGTVTMQDSEGNKDKFQDPAKMKNYTKGLVSNWFRKDSRLNGGTKHEVQNPGSRAGSGDAGVKEMRKLLKALTEAGDTENVKAVQGEIDLRLAEIRKEKAKKIDINPELIPEHLRDLIS
jgi:hypothetical protein